MKPGQLLPLIIEATEMNKKSNQSLMAIHGLTEKITSKINLVHIIQGVEKTNTKLSQ